MSPATMPRGPNFLCAHSPARPCSSLLIAAESAVDRALFYASSAPMIPESASPLPPRAMPQQPDALI